MQQERIFDELDDLLDRICVKLQLNKTRKERVEVSYKALCEVIENSDGYFSEFETKDFYAQGSYRIQTTVKPKGIDEFDLDFILEIKDDWKRENPMKLLDELYKVFKENGIYKEKVEKKNRCIRINYENDFHIDILPSFSFKNNEEDDTEIKVPDRELKNWTSSNPKGYGEWFNNKSDLVDRVLLEKRFVAQVEDLPDDTPYELINPLNKVIQLLKRYRDIYYENKDSNGVRSIILTTLGADLYNGEVSIATSLSNIILKLENKIAKKNVIEVYNPINSKEKFSEKWNENPTEYREFCEFIISFKQEWFKIVKVQGLNEKAKLLKEIFGENIVNESFTEQAIFIKKLRANNKLQISTTSGILMINENKNYKKVTNHTFYGE